MRTSRLAALFGPAALATAGLLSGSLLTPVAASAPTAASPPLTSPPLTAPSVRSGTAAGSPDDAVRHDRWRGSGEPLVIGHRGASGYRPEHTLASYQLAIALGADYIEPDLVSTKDGVLVARHENEISGTTNVEEHPEFADRRATKTIDGVEVTGWFTEDFTLAELKTLRAEERLPDVRQHNTLYDGRYRIPTFQQVLDLAARQSRLEGRPIGVYPETKHPTYFDSIGLSLEEPLVRALDRNYLNRRRAEIFVQSFETTNLKELDEKLRVPLVQLIGSSGAPYDLIAAGDPRTYADLITRKGLREISTYADGIGPDKTLIIPWAPDGSLLEPTSLVDDAHAADLLVHPYTFRNENVFLPADFRRGAEPDAYGNAFAEYRAYFRLGVDGVFSDNPDTAREAAADFQRSKRERMRVQLLGFNDFHGALEPGFYEDQEVGGAAYVAGWIRKLSRPERHTLVVSAGDMIGGTPLLSALFHDEPTIEFANLVGVDVAGVGNHEFDEGVDELLRMVRGGCHPEDGCFGGDGFAGASFPYLAANVVWKDTRKPILPPYVIKRVHGTAIGFIGLTLEETPSVVLPSAVEDVDFLDESRTIHRYVGALRNRGVQSVVVLIHQSGVSEGGPNECADLEGPLLDEIKSSPTEVDAWVTGHSHDAFTCRVDGDPVTMAGSSGQFLTEVDLVINQYSGEVVRSRATNHLTTHDVQPVPAVEDLVARYQALAEEQLERLVGRTDEPITRDPDDSGESALGNLVADSQAAATPDAEVALMNPGGIRADLDAGPVTYGESFDILPFGNTLVSMDLTGQQVLELLDEQWCGQDYPRILQVSAGFTYTWRDGASVACDQRVLDDTVTIGGEQLDAGATYRVVTNNFLAEGGDLFETFTEGTDRVTGDSALEAFVSYLPDDTAISAPATDRIDVTGD